MDVDRKTIALKKLQGLIWRDGYLSGLIKSQYVGKVYLRLKNEKKCLCRLFTCLLHFNCGIEVCMMMLYQHFIYGNNMEEIYIFIPLGVWKLKNYYLATRFMAVYWR